MSASRRLRVITSLLGPLIVIGLIAYLVAGHGHEVATAVQRLGLSRVALVTALAVLSLVGRTQAVVACLAAMGNRVRKLDIHAANSLTMLAATINHYVSAVVRAALIRRIDPRSAPTVPQMVLVDASTVAIEAPLVALLIVVSAGTLKLAWWFPVLAAVGGLILLGIVVLAHRRFRAHPIMRGLDVLAHSRQRVVVAALMVLVIVIQVVRTLIVLDGVGLHPSLLQATATFVTAGVLSSLLVGPSAAAAGAPLIVFGRSSLAASAAAGLVLSITSLLAAMVYSLAGGPVFVWRMRQASHESSGTTRTGTTTPPSSGTPPASSAAARSSPS
jgi:hypothetical protein